MAGWRTAASDPPRRAAIEMALPRRDRRRPSEPTRAAFARLVAGLLLDVAARFLYFAFNAVDRAFDAFARVARRVAPFLFRRSLHVLGGAFDFVLSTRFHCKCG